MCCYKLNLLDVHPRNYGISQRNRKIIENIHFWYKFTGPSLQLSNQSLSLKECTLSRHAQKQS